MLIWILAAIGGLILIKLLVRLFRQIKRDQQLAYIENYQFHPAISKKIKNTYPHLNDTQLQTVFKGLRDYFHICNLASGRMVSMPSQVVDVAWHEFILFTQEYQQFCQKSQGRFLHHMPTEAMDTPTRASGGLKRAWYLTCKKTGLDPKSPSQLPLLFAIDALLRIEDGFKYSLNCNSNQTSSDSYCATHIGCSSGCYGHADSSSWFDFADHSDGDSGGCSSGCSSGGD